MRRFAGMTIERLDELAAAMSRARVAVLGDYFLDKYLEVDPSRAELSIETGKLAHQVVAVRHSPGAAGTVVANLVSLGAASVEAIGYSGDDGEGFDLRAGLRTLGAEISHLHRAADRMTPTYLKPRDCSVAGLAGEHSRYDTKNRTVTPPELEKQLVASLDEVVPRVDAVIAIDQVDEADCGVVTSAVRHAFEDLAARYGARTIFWADSRRRVRQFRGVTIKPNQFEALGLENPPPGHEVPWRDLERGLADLRQATGAPIFATRGAQGIAVTDPELTSIPTIRASGPIDPTGAGDSVTAGCVLALAAGASAAEAALVGNLVASITIEQLATTGVARTDQLAPRLVRWLSEHQENR